MVMLKLFAWVMPIFGKKKLKTDLALDYYMDATDLDTLLLADLEMYQDMTLVHAMMAYRKHSFTLQFQAALSQN